MLLIGDEEHDKIVGNMIGTYRKISNISRTKYHNLNNSCLILQLRLSNPLKGVKSRMKM